MSTDLLNDRAFGLDENELDSETELMKSMGLPVQFGSVTSPKTFVVKPIVFSFFCTTVSC